MSQSILIVDDNTGMVQLMARMLKGVARLRFATRGDEALKLMLESAPDLVLLDAEMPGMSGYEVCEAIRADATLADIPVIFVTGHGETDAEVRGLEAGAVDFITKPVNEALLLARVRTQLRLKSMADELRSMATTDGLTGLANRRHFDELMRREWQRCARTGSSIALLMADIDHFKRYNDSYGHPGGDACLQAVAKALTLVARRPADRVGRLGGEEFVVLLPDTDVAGGQEVAEHAVKLIQALALPHVASLTAEHVTISVGVAVCTGQDMARHDPQSLYSAADHALYAAKAQGRNRWAAEVMG
ncbi:response regulator receiver modulated diguanylate cyclase [Acidovorax sp. 56]|uniref:diguanylate cyclase domain-containing protein n=1 Tax=Acidovorax sp. 56 TaxID=2035205 RepID=UPI000C1708F2|nr:diguanylate cyclase [Acidovorax sp. 56]PIF29125.1 response regulator receiver modulated diguanylate cyclase [Acidovorax sp. 56]